MTYKGITLLAIALDVCIQSQVFAEPISIRFPIYTRQPAINNPKVGYHIYTDYNSRGVSNWRHIPPNNLTVYGD